jgi:hypothetical protein
VHDKGLVNDVHAHLESFGTAVALTLIVGCMATPPDPDAIGRAGWTILHTTAAAFPHRPTSEQQQNFRDFIRSWSQVYPCSVCAYHMRQVLQTRPIVVTNKLEASRFVCELHNSVNEILDKPKFSCDPNTVLRAWHPGYPDHMEDEPTIEEQLAAARAAGASSAGARHAPPPPPPQPAAPAQPKPSRWAWIASGGSPPTSNATQSTPVAAAPHTTAKVADDETDPAKVLMRLKGCQTWCPDKSLENLAAHSGTGTR